MKVLSAEFVASAVDARAVPRDGLPQIALVGRSNVGKSTLLNALTGRRIARTSGTPGKTRLANLYRVHVQGGRPEGSGALATWRLYLVDLPGYGYAKGSKSARHEFERITDAYFRRQRPEVGGQGNVPGPANEPRSRRARDETPPRGSAEGAAAALLVIDARHPAIDADLAAREWLDGLGLPYVVVATKMDKLSRNARAGALRAIRQQHNRPVLPVSAGAGEGLDELWMEIVKLVRP